MRRFFRAPAVHFAAAGALCFLVSTILAPATGDESADRAAGKRIVIDATRIRGLQRDYALANGSPASAPATRALVDDLIIDEILFREALAMGFDKGDRSIGWRLVQKMKYLDEDQGEDPTALYQRALSMGLQKSDPIVRRILIEKMRLLIGHIGPPPADEEVVAWFESHREQYAQAARVTFRHVFFDRGRRGVDGARESAAATLAAAEGHGLEVASTLGGDPFVMGVELRAQGPNELVKLFGPRFADEVLALPEGRWGGPVESAYGWHVVFVEKRFEPRVPELREVRSRVEKTLEASRRDTRVDEYLARVRPTYSIEVDESAITAAGTSGAGNG